MIYLFYGIILLFVFIFLIKYLSNVNSNKLQSLAKITIGGVLFIISIFLLFRGLYYFSGPFAALWLTRLKTYIISIICFLKIIHRFKWIKMKHLRF